MPRGRKSVWPPHIHSRGGKEYVRVTQDGERRWLSLGPAGSDESRQAYARLLAEFASNGGRLPPAGKAVAVMEAALEWLERLKEVPNGARRRRAIGGVTSLYSAADLSEFGPKALKAVRASWEQEGLARTYINKLVATVKMWLRWCVSEELLRPESGWAHAQVEGLRRGQTEAREMPKVKPAPRADVEKTLPCLPRIVADMVRVQLLLGCRPSEVCKLRPGDITRPWKVIDGAEMWLIEYKHHKTEHRGSPRWIPVPPAAQRLLLPYLERGDDVCCFSPAESRAEWEKARRAERKTPLYPSHVEVLAKKRKKKPKRQAGEKYTRESYCRAVARACVKAGVEPWSPNQLRHTAGTEVEAEFAGEFGANAAQRFLGHSHAAATQVYVEILETAARIAAKRGC